MTYVRKQRGSALLLAVGLLTILAMLGTTFLLIARLDRRQTAALSTKAQSDPLAEGALATVQAMLLEDLHIAFGNASGPYSGGSGSATDYIDYPGEDGGTMIDPYLSSIERVRVPAETKTQWVGLSRITEDGEDADFRYVVFDDLTDEERKNYVDTNGDGIEDAYLYPSGIYNDKAEQYHIAVRVEDLSGYLNVNTAGSFEQAERMIPVTPVNIGLRSFLLNDTAFNNLRDARSPDTTSLEDYYLDCGTRLLSPDTASRDYAPFSIGDELYLRWLAENSSVDTGRIYQQIRELEGNSPANQPRRYLTSFNCVRSLVRDPGGSFLQRIPLRAGLPGPDITDPAIRQELYDRLIDALGNSEAQKKQAAHLTANLWAYAAGSNPASAYRFQPSGETFAVYGLVPQPVFSEAYAKARSDAVPPDPEVDEVQAIELFNPTGEAIDLTNYWLINQNGDEFQLTGESLAANGGRLVFFVEGSDGDATDLSLTTTGWREITTPADFLTLAGNKAEKVRLIRRVEGHDVPIDDITISNYDGPPTLAETVEEDVRRDDDIYRGRATVAEYKEYNDHRLGETNDLQETDLSGILQGFFITKAGPDGIVSLGELLNLYLTGPMDDESFPHRVKSDSSNRDRPGLLDGPSAGGEYGNVQLGAVLGEFFEVLPTDPTRQEGPTATPVESRIYGRMNINTAPKQVLAQLSFPQQISIDGAVYDKVIESTRSYYANAGNQNIYIDNGVDNINDADPEDLVDRILKYRRDNGGFRSPGEIAIPLAQFMADEIERLDPGSDNTANYLLERNQLYGDIANVIDVRSDVFVAYITVLIKGEDDSTSVPKYRANYIAVIDRSNCWMNSNLQVDKPAVLMFSPVK